MMQESNLENLKNYTPSNTNELLKLIGGLTQLKKDIDMAAQSEKETDLLLLSFEKDFGTEGVKSSLLTKEQLHCRMSTEKHGHCIQCLEELSSEVELIEDALTTLLSKYAATMRLAIFHAEEARLVAEKM